MGLVAQALDKIQHGVARLELDRLALRHEQSLAAGVAVRPLGDAEQRHVGDTELGKNLANSVELAAAAVDDDEVGPLLYVVLLGAGLVFVGWRHQPLEATLQDLL